MTSRFIYHIAIISFTMLIIGVLPNLSSAETVLVVPTKDENINLSIKPQKNEVPLRIFVPKANINLKVEISPIVNGTWLVHDTSAGFGEGSSFLDEEHGNSVVFAHARYGMFRNLGNVSKGDKIILMSDENMYEYEVRNVEKVLPQDIDRVKSAGEDNLTLFTCEGIWDEYRLLVKAKRVGVSSLNLNGGVI